MKTKIWHMVRTPIRSPLFSVLLRLSAWRSCFAIPPLILPLLTVLSAMQIACSPGSLFNPGVDQSVINTPSYRKVDPACGGLDLSSGQLSLKTFRSMVHCLNGNGSIAPIQSLVDSLSDEQLTPLLERLNRTILKSSETIYQVESTFYTLKKHGIVDASFSNFGRVLQKDLVRSGLALLKDGYFLTSSNRLRLAGEVKKDEDLLRVLEILSQELTPKQVEVLLDIALNLTGSKAFQGLQNRLSRQIDDKSVLKEAVQGLHAYLSSNHTYSCDAEGTQVPISREWKEAVMSGDWFTVQDELLGKKREDVVRNVAGFTYLLQHLLNPVPASVLASFNPTRSWEDPSLAATPRVSSTQPVVQSVIHAMQQFHRPIDCVKGVQSVSDGARHIVSRLASFEKPEDALRYVYSDGKLELVALRPACVLPDGLAGHYQSLIQLAQTGAMVPMVKMMKAMHQPVALWPGCSSSTGLSPMTLGESYHPLTSWMVNLLGDLENSVKEDRASSESLGALVSSIIKPKKEEKGVLSLLPLLQRTAEYDVFPEVLLLAVVPTDDQMTVIQDKIKFLIHPRAELGGKSVFDVFMQAVSRASVKHLVEFATAAHAFIQSEDFRNGSDFFQEGLGQLRSAFHANDVHPFLDVLKSSMSEATQEAQFYDVFFEIADNKHFGSSIELIAKMARNGDLAKISEDVLHFFHDFAQKGQMKILAQETIPPFVARRNLDLVRGDLDFSELGPKPAKALGVNAACENLSLDFALDNPKGSGFKDDLANFLACLERTDPDGNNTTQYAEAVQKLLDNTADGNFGDISLYEHVVQMIKRFTDKAAYPETALGEKELRYFADRWLDSVKTGKIFRATEALPYFIPDTIPNFQSPDSFLGYAFSIIGEVMKKSGQDVRGLQETAAKVLSLDNFPVILQDLLQLRKEYLAAKEEETPQEGGVESKSSSGNNNEQSLDESETQDFAVYPPTAEIEKWVRIKECADIPTHPIEAEQYIAQRVQEIIHEARESVNGWELIIAKNRSEFGSISGKKTRTSWTVPDVSPYLAPMIEKMADPAQSLKDHPFSGAMVKFLKGFAGNKNKTPQHLLEWLHRRSIDYRLISYYYPGADRPRVRLVNSLDRLELVLLNTDIEHPWYLKKLGFSKNLGLEFLSEISEAWGDLPRRDWPQGIQVKYPHPKRPRTIWEAVQHITKRSSAFEDLESLSYKVIGLPRLPSCNKNQFVPDKQSGFLTGGDFIWFGLDIDGFRRRLFNIWQTTGVLEENAPHSPLAQASVLSDGRSKEPLQDAGLGYLRDLFYEVGSTTPYVYQDAAASNLNNLSGVLWSNYIGALRQIGRKLQQTEVHDPDLIHFVSGLVRTAAAPGGEEMFQAVIDAGPGQKLVWTVIEELFRLIDAGGRPLRNIKDAGFYGLAGLDKMDPSVAETEEEVREDDEAPVVARPSRIAELLNKRITEVLQEEGAFLARQRTLIRKGLHARGIGRAVKKASDLDEAAQKRMKQVLELALEAPATGGRSSLQNGMGIFKAIYNNEATKEHFDKALVELDAMKEKPGFPKKTLEDLELQLLRFFAHQSDLEEDLSADPLPASEAAKGASDVLRKNAVRLLSDGELDPFLRMIEKDPEGATLILQVLKQSTQGGQNSELGKFLKMVRESLSAPAH